MSTLRLLQWLPEELLQDVLERLERPALEKLSLASRWCYDVATAHLWREVELVDCKTEYLDANDQPECDDHDDTPLLKKLFLLATKPWLSAQVQVLTHRCHLPPPAIFHELPNNTFSAQTLSTDPRTIELVKMAVRNMQKVHTLRITFGHPHLTDALLRCFFDARRMQSGCTRVRKLWLENCRVSAGLNPAIDWHAYGLPLRLDFTGLESVRFRRLPLRASPLDNTSYYRHMSYSRDCQRRRPLQDGVGGRYEASVSDVFAELRVGDDYARWYKEKEKDQRQFRDPTGGLAAEHGKEMGVNPLLELYEAAHRYDEQIYAALTALVELPEQVSVLGALTRHERAEMAYRGSQLDLYPPSSLVVTIAEVLQMEKIPSARAALLMLKNASSTLTSLNFDWVMGIPLDAHHSGPGSTIYWDWLDIYHRLFGCRFPSLRCFQMRNCVVSHTAIPSGLFLLDTCPALVDHLYPLNNEHENGYAPPQLAPLAFMEAHPDIECLAWPMSSFFSQKASSAEVTKRVDAVLENLARNLVDLRVDTKFSENGEAYSEEGSSGNYDDCIRRKRFIAEFAPRMKHVECIKIEGGMPRDERREVVRALYACPLQKIVMIGICSPTGNSWGHNGASVVGLVDEDDRSHMEAEDTAAVYELGPSKLLPPSTDFQFSPQYGWEGQPPMLHTLASYHADTIRELKFCGWKGSPVLLSPTPITSPLLAPLKHFHHLDTLIISLWLTTLFEGDTRDNEVISYWTDARSPASQALVLITDEEPEWGWDKELRTKYAPDALAWRVTNFLGPFLSESAKSRKGGVHVRASFGLGDWGGIFDLDLSIGKGALTSDVCLRFTGPREELEKERRREKLDGRRWF